jgi:hypothetical protein
MTFQYHSESTVPDTVVVDYGVKSMDAESSYNVSFPTCFYACSHFRKKTPCRLDLFIKYFLAGKKKQTSYKQPSPWKVTTPTILDDGHVKHAAAIPINRPTHRALFVVQIAAVRNDLFSFFCLDCCYTYFIDSTESYVLRELVL